MIIEPRELIRKPRRQILRYYGSKWRIMGEISRFHPPHYAYISGCAGGASDLFNKTPSFIEIYNDLDDWVVTFFRVLRDHTQELIEAILLTPFSRAELNRSNQFAKGKLENVTDVEKARLLYVRSWMGRSSNTSRWNSSFRSEVKDGRSKPIIEEWSEVDQLWVAAARLKTIYIETMPVLKLMDKYDHPNNLFYLDPPYPLSTRYRRWGQAYKHEWKDSDHVDLAGKVHEIEGMAIISSYPNSLYDKLYAGWENHEIKSRTNNNSQKIEKIWLNPNCSAKQRQQNMFKEEI